jgi:hypothetical protein
MTLGNMCANSVRSLAASCWLCHHGALLAVDRWPDDMPAPSSGPRMVSTGYVAHPKWTVDPVEAHNVQLPDQNQAASKVHLIDDRVAENVRQRCGEMNAETAIKIMNSEAPGGAIGGRRMSSDAGTRSNATKTPC